MRRFRASAAGVIALAIIASACGGATDSVATAPAATAAQPELIAETIDGQQIDFVDMLDEDAVLWFWAPW